MKVNDVNGDTRDIRGPAKYMPSSGAAYLTRALNALVDILGAAVAGVVRWVGDRQIRHEMWLELQAMSDSALEDFGITRRGIDAAVDAAMAGRRARGRRAAMPRVHDIQAAANDDAIDQAA